MVSSITNLPQFLVRHEPPQPFTWGEEYKGSGGSQLLAASLIYDATGSELAAKMHAHAFAAEYLTNLPPSGFTFHADTIRQWVEMRDSILASVQNQTKGNLARV